MPPQAKRLNEKLHEVYSEIDFIEKAGQNKSQDYKFMRSADVVRAVRTALIAHRVYAEINFDFVGGPFTIARAKEPNAPFSAVIVKCSLVFHDLDSPEVSTGSGLGMGCDSNDKGAGKAQTNALKYALKNSFLVPDEADPEADESVDEKREPEDMPSFHQETTQAVPAAKTAPKPAKAAARPTAAPAAKAEASKEPATTSNTSKASKAETAAAVAETREPGDEAAGAAEAFGLTSPDAVRDTPTEAELTVYRQQFRKLGDDLSTEGKLKSSKSLPIERKLLVFLLKITETNDPALITKAQWDDFFARVQTSKDSETGLVGLATLINRVNGVEKK